MILYFSFQGIQSILGQHILFRKINKTLLFKNFFFYFPKKWITEVPIAKLKNKLNSFIFELSVNPKFLAIIVESGGGGAFLCIPHSKVAKIK